MPTNTIEKVMERYVVKIPDGCWLWIGAKNKAGYGVVKINNVYWLVHRLVYEFHVGPIPVGLDLDHVKERCINKHCCNPAHLEPVTHKENCRRFKGPYFHSRMSPMRFKV